MSTLHGASADKRTTHPFSRSDQSAYLSEMLMTFRLIDRRVVNRGGSWNMSMKVEIERADYLDRCVAAAATACAFAGGSLSITLLMSVIVRAATSLL